MSKIVLYGGRGWIGQMIYNLLQHNGYNVIISDTRVSDYSVILNELKELQPTHVICTIGRTSGFIQHSNNFSQMSSLEHVNNIDYLEYPGKLKENLHDNLYGPLVLAKATSDLGIHLTYMGTGCIFTYSNDNPEYLFSELDSPNFFGSSYFTVKGCTDSLMKTFSNVLNVRIRMPISLLAHPKDFITKIVGFSNICSIPNSMTVLEDLLPVMLDMSLKNMTGTINLVNPGVISHNEILQMYKEIVDPNHTWNCVPFQSLAHLKSDRSNNAMSTHKLANLYPHVPNIATSVKNILLQRAGKVPV